MSEELRGAVRIPTGGLLAAGELSEREREALERAALVDDEVFEELTRVETEVLDAFARDELEASVRRTVAEVVAASPRLHHRAQVAQALAQRADEEASRAETASVVPFLQARVQPPSAGLRWLAAAVVAGLGVGSLWLVGTVWQQGEQLAAARQEVTALDERTRQLEAEIVAQRGLATAPEQDLVALPEEPGSGSAAVRPSVVSPPAPVASDTVSFVLSLAVLRSGGEVPNLPVPVTAERVRLELDLEGDIGYESFRALVRDQRGGLVWSRAGLAVTSLEWGDAVVLELPAQTLAPGGRYQVTILGREGEGQESEVGYYDLEIGRP